MLQSAAWSCWSPAATDLARVVRPLRRGTLPGRWSRRRGAGAREGPLHPPRRPGHLRQRQV